MKKPKRPTNNPNGRPRLPLELRAPVIPARQLGRVPAAEWAELKAAAERDGKYFLEWALPILLAAARQPKKPREK